MWLLVEFTGGNRRSRPKDFQIIALVKEIREDSVVILKSYINANFVPKGMYELNYYRAVDDFESLKSYYRSLGLSEKEMEKEPLFISKRDFLEVVQPLRFTSQVIDFLNLGVERYRNDEEYHLLSLRNEGETDIDVEMFYDKTLEENLKQRGVEYKINNYDGYTTIKWKEPLYEYIKLVLKSWGIPLNETVYDDVYINKKPCIIKSSSIRAESYKDLKDKMLNILLNSRRDCDIAMLCIC